MEMTTKALDMQARLLSINTHKGGHLRAAEYPQLVKSKIIMIQPPAMIIQLIHMEGPMKGEIQEFEQSEISIGRSPTCQVCFPKDLAIVSRVHARIVREGNRFMLMDQSTNGTFVNGKPVKEAILKDGDILLFAEGGPKVSFFAQLSDGGVRGDSVEKPAMVSPASESFTPQPPVVAVEPSSLPPQPPVFPPVPPPPSQEIKSGPPPVFPVSPPPISKPTVMAADPPIAPTELPVLQIKRPLVVQYGPTLQAYNSLPVTIGKGTQCDFRLDHPAVFERHAQIFFYQEQYWVKDLTGKSVVKINGRSIENQGMLDVDYRLSLSDQGPDFRFLGGGRLAEVEVVAPEPSPTASHREGGEDGSSQGNAVKHLGAMMKKMLKR